MADRYVEAAKEKMGALERLILGLPGIKDYREKEMRRGADRRLRQTLADRLSGAKEELLRVQNALLSNGGLRHMSDVEREVVHLQTLTDRIRTASYGYSGLFDAVKVGDDELRALHKFDVALAGRVLGVQTAIESLQEAVKSDGADDGSVSTKLSELSEVIRETTTALDGRHEAIVNPDLLMDTTLVPQVDDSDLDFDASPFDSASGSASFDSSTDASALDDDEVADSLTLGSSFVDSPEIASGAGASEASNPLEAVAPEPFALSDDADTGKTPTLDDRLGVDASQIEQMTAESSDDDSSASASR